MSEEQMNAALDEIHDQALKLLGKDMSEEVKHGLEIIISLARYKHLIPLTDLEKARADKPGTQ